MQLHISIVDCCTIFQWRNGILLLLRIDIETIESVAWKKYIILLLVYEKYKRDVFYERWAYKFIFFASAVQPNGFCQIAQIRRDELFDNWCSAKTQFHTIIANLCDLIEIKRIAW